jgi:PIN domain nuclease of toxin-antitoxin system
VTRYLLDTHVWIWANQAPDEMGKKCAALLLDAESQLFVSTISHLEVARLVAHKRLQLACSIREWCERGLSEIDASVVDMDPRIALEAYDLPGVFHEDPSDRIIVATARVQGLTLLTADERILKYASVKTIHARR